MRISFFYLILLFLIPQISLAISEAEEYEIKAAYLFNLGNFIKWPATSQDSFEICVLGQDVFKENLDLIAKKEKKLQNKLAVIKKKSSLDDVNQCSILFINFTEQSQFQAAFDKLKGKPILTVGDTEKFIIMGGMIQFYLQAGKIRLMIDPQTLDENNLKASSKLLQISQRVER